MSFEKAKTQYETTVQNQYFCFITGYDDNGKPQYEDKVYESGVVTNIKSTKTAPSKEIYASGKMYDQLMKRKNTVIELTALGMPRVVYDKASGEVREGAFSFEPTSPKRVHFAYGFAKELDDGTKAFRWYPDCILGNFDDESKTETADLNEPSATYSITALPYKDSCKTDYYQSDVAEGETPLTAEQFFAQPIICKEDIPTNADDQTDAG